MRLFVAQSDWALAGKCWQCQLLPLGTVFVDRSCDSLGPRLSLGDMSMVGVRSWPLHKLWFNRSGALHTVFQIDHDIPDEGLPYHHCHDLSQITVVPTKAIAPARGSLLHNEVDAGGCVCLHQTDEAMSVMENACRQGFWKLPKHILDKVAESLGLPRCASELNLITSILQAVFPDAVVGEFASMLEKRGVDQTEAIDDDPTSRVHRGLGLSQ